MSFALFSITTNQDDHPERFASFGTGKVILNQPNIGLVQRMDAVWRENHERIIAFAHYDVTVLDPNWKKRILAEFQDPKVAIVGFGGATEIGLPDLYKVRYQITQLQRRDYRSNAIDWDTHGKLEEGSRNVAVLDGFFMAFRSSFLDSIGGFSWMPFSFHCYDLCVCLRAWEEGWKVRMVGIKCHHHGGGTSTSQEYKRWCEDHGSSMELEHSRPHEWMYERFRSLLPFQVGDLK